MANAHNDQGPEGLKIFNIGFLAGMLGLLLTWNSAILIKVTVSDQYIPGTAACLGKTLDTSTFYPITVALGVMSLCVVFSVIITVRTYTYLSTLQDIHLCNLPSKNVLTYIDTLVLFSIVSGSGFFKLFCTFTWIFDVFSWHEANLVTCIFSIIIDDIGIGITFPIYIIIKTKRYLPKLWDDSRQIVVENNDFFSINPATVAPWPPATNQQIAESSL